MISFIIIGKNIENTIEQCIKSVLQFVDLNNIKESEIVYIDSDSQDNTLIIAQKFPIRILLITGNVNAAIARNVGAQYSKGDILFFLDGDMELFPHFFEFVFKKGEQTLIYPFVNGYMKEKYYDNDFKFLYSKDEKISDEPLFDHVTGGLLIVEKREWARQGGMDERLIRNQDLDFGLRMSKSGLPVLKDNHYWIIHHTISYYDKKRLSYFYKSKALLSPGILMRRHIFNMTYLKLFRRNVFYALILLASIVILFIHPLLSLLLFVVYIFIQLLRTMFLITKEKQLVQSFLFKILFNFYTLIGFLFYYPQAPVFTITLIR
jgi:glycosyltransferase involved in cell wall biosynthesis